MASGRPPIRSGRSGTVRWRPAAIRRAVQAAAAASRTSSAAVVPIPGSSAARRIPSCSSSRRRSIVPFQERLGQPAGDPFIAANRALARQLPGVEAHFPGGGHDDDFWSGNVAAEMAWAAARL